MKVYSNKVRGAMYGVAVGDALGAPLEFMSAESIKRQHGAVREMIGGGWLNVKPGEITDDTQMTLCVAHGIVESPENPTEAIGRYFVRWYMDRPKDVGATCASSISAAMRLAQSGSPSAKDWRRASQEVHRLTGGRSGGNGALMRTAYIGLYYQDTSTIISRAAHVAQMTHYDNVAAADCAIYSLILHSLSEQESEKNGKQIISDILLANSGSAMRYDPETLSGDGFTPTPSGWGVASLQAALHCIFTTDSFEEALVKAVNLGGDADTIGAITGGLAGALYGYDSIPDRWKASLDTVVSLELDDLCNTALSKKD